MKSMPPVGLWMLLTIVGGCLSVSVAPAAALKDAASLNTGFVDELFGQPKVFVLKIDVPPASLEQLKANPSEYVKATLRESDKIYSDIGLRIRGGKAFRSIELTPSLVVKFNEFISGTRFHGHSRIFLGNSEDDPSYLKKAIGGEVFRAANAPAPKISWARLTLNGNDAGLYLIEQAVNREFLSDYFEKTKGNLYEGSNADVDQKLEQDGGSRDKEQSDLKALAEAARENDPAQRLKNLETVLDLDRFVSFAAAEVLTSHHKGYTLDLNNYRVYHNPVSDKMVFIPHDLDDLFARPQMPAVPEWKGLVARAVFETPEGQRRYRARLGQLLETVGKAETLQARVNELSRILRPLLPRNAPELRTFDGAVAQLSERISERVRYLSQDLKKAPASK